MLRRSSQTYASTASRRGSSTSRVGRWSEAPTTPTSRPTMLARASSRAFDVELRPSPERISLDIRRLPGLTPYAEGWELQRELVGLRKRDEVPDTLVLLEHPPVYTVGRAAKDASNLGAGGEDLKYLGG